MNKSTHALLAAACAAMIATPTLADTLELDGVIRDFKRGDWSSGHPDFQTAPSLGGFGHVTGMVTMSLTEDGKPEYNPIRPNKDTITSAASLDQWFKDVPQLNVSTPMTLTLDNGQSEPGGVYSFQSNSFFPVDGKLYGNQGLSHNYHFTFELNTSFTYEPGQYFTFIGDDDVWVYIQGKRVIDLGGVHPAETGSVLLFDGKAFVESSDFPLGGEVMEVTSAMATEFAQEWQYLGLDGDCPIETGDRYVDLNLNNGGNDSTAEFNNTSVTVTAAADLERVVVQYNDYTEETFDDLDVGNSETFSGTGDHAGKLIVGVWIDAGGLEETDKGNYVSLLGNEQDNVTLDFFFAERHTTQSNFRIDTSILLEPIQPTTISPLYD